MHGAGQLMGGPSGGNGSKPKIVQDIAERDLLNGKIGDGQVVIVRNAIADNTVNDPDKPRATYLYHKDGVPTTWEKLSEEESVDLSLYASLDPDAVTIQKIGDIPAGTRYGDLAGRELLGIVLDMLFETVYHEYQNPTASTNVPNTSIEVGEVFSQEVIASFNQQDAGPVNRVQIQINEADVQDTSTPALDYSYDDNNQVLADGQTRRYRTIIHYDEGPVIKDTSGKGLDSPGNVQAGSVISATRTKTARRKIFAQMSVALPANSVEVRALTSVQFDNDNTLNLAVQNGDSSITIALPANRTLASAIFQSTLGVNADHTAELLASESTISVEGGGPGYAQNYRLLRLQPPASYTQGTYVLTFSAI